MSSTNRINEIVANLRGRLARGGMTYEDAVIADHLISVFERMAAEDRKIDRSVPPALPQTAFEIYLRDIST